MNSIFVAGLSSVLLASWPLSCTSNSGSTTLLVQSKNEEFLDGVLISVVGRPGQPTLGDWQSDLSNPVGSAYSFGQVLTDDDGDIRVPNGRLNANWWISMTLDPPCVDNVNYDPPRTFTSISGYYNIYNTGGNFGSFAIVCDQLTSVEPDSIDTGFSTNTVHPSTITVKSNQPLTSNYGMPILRFYGNGNSGAVLQETATSISSDGLHATFPYPLVSGAPLPPNLYTWVLINQGPSGHVLAGNYWMAVGQADTTDYTYPFGIDALTFSQSGQTCRLLAGNPEQIKCTPMSNVLLHYPIVTMYQLGQVKYNGTVLAVGSDPTVVRAYNVKTVRESLDGFGGYVTTTQALNAIVVNTGSNTISILNLPSASTAATIPVGNQPVDARVSPDGSQAYIVNYGSETVSVVSLTSNTVTNTITLGGKPTSISLDGSGNAWIGGVGFIDQLNLSSLAVTSTSPVSATITGLAYSSGQSQLLTAVAPSSTSSTVAAISFSPNNKFAQSAVINSTGAYSAYSNSVMASELLWPSQLSTGVLVSAHLNNLIGLSASGSSFSVIDVHNGETMLTGQAPGVIRGLAVDSAEGVAYITIPDSNEVISVQIPAPLVVDSSGPTL